MPRSVDLTRVGPWCSCSTEEELKEAGIKYNKGVFPFQANRFVGRGGAGVVGDGACRDASVFAPPPCRAFVGVVVR